jgi:hypothetical protein
MPSFKKDALQELNGESETLKKVSDTITGKRRWSLSHELIFQETSTGRFFLTHYSEGSTEQQDESPYEYDGEDIEVQEVRPVERTVTVYEPAPVESP